MRIQNQSLLKFAVTCGALTIAVLHLKYPLLRIDFVTVCLLAFAILPWFQSLFKAVELPGGFKLEFQDLKRIEEEAKSAGIIDSQPKDEAQSHQKAPYSFQLIDPRNQTLALVGFRVELEQTLRRIAHKYGKVGSKHRSLRQTINDLATDHILTDLEVATLQDMIHTLNQAAHGIEYDERTGDWIMETAPRILHGLENRVQHRGGMISHANPEANEHWIDQSFKEAQWSTNSEWSELISKHSDLWRAELNNIYKALQARLDPEQALVLKESQENWEQQYKLDERLFSSLLPKIQLSIGREGYFLAATNSMNQIRERTLKLEDYLNHMQALGSAE